MHLAELLREARTTSTGEFGKDQKERTAAINVARALRYTSERNIIAVEHRPPAKYPKTRHLNSFRPLA